MLSTYDTNITPLTISYLKLLSWFSLFKFNGEKINFSEQLFFINVNFLFIQLVFKKNKYLIKKIFHKKIQKSFKISKIKIKYFNNVIGINYNLNMYASQNNFSNKSLINNNINFIFKSYAFFCNLFFINNTNFLFYFYLFSKIKFNNFFVISIFKNKFFSIQKQKKYAPSFFLTINLNFL